MQLLIGNKNYSSWSMRPWVLMRQFGIRFEEVMIRFDSMAADSVFKQRIGAVSPAAKVPVLVQDDGFVVWDTLAIAETLADQFPSLALWPADARQRARARSLCAEMHSGFGALRSHCPMNIEASLPHIGQKVMAEQPAVVADLQRIVHMWTEALNASGGPFLFGGFSIADAYFAPVTFRITTYGLPVPAPVAAYVRQVQGTQAVQAWVQGALAEHDFVAFDEPYRAVPPSRD
ncbi:MAG: glutathione S-transferase family protein [Rubrivivax sp.]|nr:glutathione S-transferase family protein [Rubrivivax sp.]